MARTDVPTAQFDGANLDRECDRANFSSTMTPASARQVPRYVPGTPTRLLGEPNELPA